MTNIMLHIFRNGGDISTRACIRQQRATYRGPRILFFILKLLTVKSNDEQYCAIDIPSLIHGGRKQTNKYNNCRNGM